MLHTLLSTSCRLAIKMYAQAQSRLSIHARVAGVNNDPVASVCHPQEVDAVIITMRGEEPGAQSIYVLRPIRGRTGI